MAVVRVVGLDAPADDVPFALARRVLSHVAPEDPGGQLRIALRPFFHYPRRDDESSVPRIKGELRLPTSRRAVRNFRFAGRLLREAGVTGVEIRTASGSGLTDADSAFVRTLATVMPVTVRLDSTVIAPAGSPPAGRSAGDLAVAGAAVPSADAETGRVLAARDAIVAEVSDRRPRLWCRTMAGFLSNGDPWTARWMAEQVIAAGIVVDAEVADVVSAAYLFSDAVHTARDFARMALSRDGTPTLGGREQALALYTLAIIELRYLPASLCRRDEAVRLLDRARALLEVLPFDEVASEAVLVANAVALDHLDAGRGEMACSVVRDAIATIVEHGHGGTTAHAILLSNLGRASARTHGVADNDEALTALQDAVAIEGDNPEGWLDLAHHLAQAGRFTDAISAARAGLKIVDMFPDLHDILGYCLAATGHHRHAADAYRDGLHAGGDPAVLGPAAVRQLLAAGEHGAARALLAAVPDPRTDRAASAELAVLAVEAEQSTDPQRVVARLTEITERFPDSELARENLTAALAWRDSPAPAGRTTPGADTTPGSR